MIVLLRVAFKEYMVEQDLMLSERLFQMSGPCNVEWISKQLVVWDLWDESFQKCELGRYGQSYRTSICHQKTKGVKYICTWAYFFYSL